MQVAGCGCGLRVRVAAGGLQVKDFALFFPAKNLGLVNAAKWRCYTCEYVLYAR